MDAMRNRQAAWQRAERRAKTRLAHAHEKEYRQYLVEEAEKEGIASYTWEQISRRKVRASARLAEHYKLNERAANRRAHRRAQQAWLESESSE
jgi:hypothetical protein